MSDSGHERRFCHVCSTSAYPPRPDVKADISDKRWLPGQRSEPIHWQSDRFSSNRVQVAHLEVARVSCTHHCDARPAQGIASAGDMEILGDNHCARQAALLHDGCAILCRGQRVIPIFIEDDGLAWHLPLAGEIVGHYAGLATPFLVRAPADNGILKHPLLE